MSREEEARRRDDFARTQSSPPRCCRRAQGGMHKATVDSTTLPLTSSRRRRPPPTRRWRQHTMRPVAGVITDGDLMMNVVQINTYPNVVPDRKLGQHTPILFVLYAFSFLKLVHEMLDTHGVYNSQLHHGKSSVNSICCRKFKGFTEEFEGF